MKKFIYIVMGAALMMSSFVYAAGRPCMGADGKVCNSGTQNCICKHDKRMPGEPCKDVNGNTCHSGTQGCMCKH